MWKWDTVKGRSNIFKHAKAIWTVFDIGVHTLLCMMTSPYLNPTIGYSLQMLHFAWCFAVSAAESLWRTGSHTILCGSCCSQFRKWIACRIYIPYGKVHLFCEPGYVIPCVHNIMEEKFHLIKSEFPACIAGNMLRIKLVNIY
jgi:hypothetical protein